MDSTGRTNPRFLAALARRAIGNPALVTLVGSVLLFVLGEAVTPGFMSLRQVMGQLTVASILALVAAGQGLAILSGREGIDLSVGSVMSLSALLAGNVMNGQNEMIIPAILVAVGTGFGVGLFNGIGITVLRIAPLVMTLGTAGVITGLLVVLTQGQTSGAAAQALKDFVVQPFLFGVPGIILIFAGAIIGLHVLLRNTRFGFALYAVGSNDIAAALSGVRVRWVRTLAYGCSAAFAGFAGLMLLGFSGTVFVGAGEQFILPSVIVVVIGGTSLAGGRGTFTGTAMGAVFLTLLTAVLTAVSLGPAERQIVFGLILIMFMMAYGRE